MMKRTATCAALAFSLLAVVLLSAGCSSGADEEKMKAYERKLNARDRRIEELKKERSRLVAEVASLRKAVLAPIRTETGPAPGEDTTEAAAKRLRKIISDARSIMFSVRAARGKTEHNAIVVAGKGTEQLLITPREVYESKRAISGDIRRDVFQRPFMPETLEGKRLAFEPFDVVGVDPELKLALVQLPARDAVIQSPSLGDESTLDPGKALVHIGWPRAGGKPPRDAGLDALGSACAIGAVKQLPAEHERGMLVVSFAVPGSYNVGDPIFDPSNGQVVGLVAEVIAQPSGAEVNCLPGSRLMKMVDDLMSARRQTVAGAFTLAAPVKTMLLTQDGKYLAGLSVDQDLLIVFSATDGKFVRSVAVDPSPVGVAECNGKLFVSSKLGQTVTVVDLAALSGETEPVLGKIRLSAALPTLIVGPADGTGERLYCLAGAPGSQQILALPPKVGTDVTDESLTLSDLPGQLGGALQRGRGVTNMALSADGTKLYLLSDSAKPTTAALAATDGYRVLGTRVLAAQGLAIPGFGRFVVGYGGAYSLDLNLDMGSLASYAAVFNARLPYFVALQVRGKPVSIAPWTLQDKPVDALGIHAMEPGVEGFKKVATLAPPPITATWAAMSADGKVYLVNHRTRRCVVLRTDTAVLTGQVPNPVINAPPTRVLLGETLVFEPKLLRPKAAGDSFSLTGAKGATLDEASGKITWKPTPNDLGAASMTLTFRPAAGLPTALLLQLRVELLQRAIEGAQKKPLIRFVASPDKKRIYGLDTEAAAVAEFDAVTLKPLRRITVGARPVDCAFREEKLYVLCAGSKAVNIVDAAAGKVEKVAVLQDVVLPFALAVGGGNAMYIGHDSFNLIQMNAVNPRKQEKVLYRFPDRRGRMGSYQEFKESFIRLAVDERGSHVAVMPEVGQFKLFSVQAGKLTLDMAPETFTTAAGSLVARFGKLTATSFIDAQRRRWLLRNRVYDLRGSTAKVTPLKGELLVGARGSDFLYSLAPGRQRADNSNAFTSVILTVFDAGTLKELDSWDVLWTAAYDVLEVDGGVILVGTDKISRVPVDFAALRPAASTP